MSELFEIYQSNLKEKFSEVSKDLEIIKNDPNKEMMTKIEINLKECDKLIKTLEIQISTSPDPNYTLYVKNFKGGCDQYKKKFKIEKEKYKEKMNADLIGISTDDSCLSAKVSLSEEIAYNSFNKLEQAHRSALSVEGIGNEVMMEMHDQTESMKGITGKVKNVGERIDTSSSLITEMDNRNKRNKSVIIIFGSMLVIIFIGILILRFIPFGKGSYSKENTLTTNSTGAQS